MTIQFSPAFQVWVGLLAAKRALLRSNPKIRTLCLGSSHGDFGFDPSHVPESFNLCCRSQDLKHSLYLYRKRSTGHPTIENVVLIFSVFSSGWNMEQHPEEGQIAVAINEMFDLDLTYDDPHLSSLYGMIKGKLGEISLSLSVDENAAGFFPTAGKGFFPPTHGVEKRAAEHLNLNAQPGELSYLEEMLDLIRQNRHRAIIVLAPARADYRHHIGSGQKVFHQLRSIVRNRSHSEVTVLDLYDYEGFDDSDFGDTDHLHPLGVGAKHLSRLVRDAVMRTA
jgi:hypothetical protein